MRVPTLVPPRGFRHMASRGMTIFYILKILTPDITRLSVKIVISQGVF